MTDHKAYWSRLEEVARAEAVGHAAAAIRALEVTAAEMERLTENLRRFAGCTAARRRARYSLAARARAGARGRRPAGAGAAWTAPRRVKPVANPTTSATSL